MSRCTDGFGYVYPETILLVSIPVINTTGVRCCNFTFEIAWARVEVYMADMFQWLIKG